tara:strand:- start:988 stop:1476 length:489 start_codon:yes stop_codon:yes gene_type:complete
MLYFFAFQHQLNRVWDQRIWEETYNESNTELMEIPLSIPYMANQEDFQTTNLSMEIEGQFLRVIKQRYQNDTLQVIYIKDPKQQKLEKQVSDWIKTITDHSQNNNENRTLLFGKFFPKDFMPNELSNIKIVELKSGLIKIGTGQNEYTDIFLSIKSPPPQAG